MKDARLVWVCKTNLGWFLPCLNWFVTNNPDKSTGIISRHLGSEQGRPKELRLWDLRYGSLFAFFFFFLTLRAIQKFCFKTASGSLLPFTCGWHWFMCKWLFCLFFFFFFWLDFLFAQLPGWLIQLFLKATFSSFYLSMHHWQQIFQAWVKKPLSLRRSPWCGLVFIGVLSCMRSCQGTI